MKKEGLILERDLEEMVLIDKDDVNDERLLDIVSHIFSLAIVLYQEEILYERTTNYQHLLSDM